LLLSRLRAVARHEDTMSPNLFFSTSFLRSAIIGLVLALLAGCTVGYSARARGRLVSVSPGVWVVEDRPDPVFYSDDYYWRYQGGVWYRSSYDDRSFVVVQPHTVPVHVRTIDRPQRYIHYQAPARARVRVSPPPHPNRARVHVRPN
jgi:hypothetical protein